MSGLKAALVVMHPHVYTELDPSEHPKVMVGKTGRFELKYTKEEYIKRLNRLWAVFGAEGLPRITLLDLTKIQFVGNWSPVVQQDVKSKYVIVTEADGPRPTPGGHHEKKLAQVIADLKAQGISDVFFVGGYRAECVLGAIETLFSDFRCWILWDLCVPMSFNSEEVDYAWVKRARYQAPERIRRVASGTILTRERFRVFLDRVARRR